MPPRSHGVLPASQRLFQNWVFELSSSLEVLVFMTRVQEWSLFIPDTLNFTCRKKLKSEFLWRNCRFWIGNDLCSRFMATLLPWFSLPAVAA